MSGDLSRGYTDGWYFVRSGDEDPAWRSWWDRRDRARFGMLNMCALSAVAEVANVVHWALAEPSFLELRRVTIPTSGIVHGVLYVALLLPFVYWLWLELEAGDFLAWH